MTLYSNNVLVGLPILDRAYGPGSLASGFVIVSLHAPFCYCIGIVAMEFARANGRGFTATVFTATKTMFSNVLTLAIVFGFLVNVAETPVPAFFTAATELFAQSACRRTVFTRRCPGPIPSQGQPQGNSNGLFPETDHPSRDRLPPGNKGF